MSAGPGPLEHADGERSFGFPRSWGVPRGTAFSVERRDWVTNNVRRHVLDRRETPPWTATGKQTPAERRAEIERKRRPPW